jgi:4-amino-4-deoxy-L-arabinose transferase-like glycosyltransferase
VENHPAAQPATSQLSLASRAGWAVLIVATLYVCYFSHLGAIGFVGPDEPRYAWIARDMAETGDWVTPRLYGKPWFEKPPLFYWAAALSFKLFGVSEASARLPSAVSALLATLALAWLAWPMYGQETARWLLLLLPTTVGMIGFSHAAATDMPFSGMLTIAMVFAAVLLGLAPNLNQSPSLASFTSFTSSTSFTSVFFGFFLGLAVLAKGPVGIALCGGAVFFWALFTKRWRDAFRLLHPAGVAAFCATALPWYILCARRNPDFFRIFIIEHNFKRYLTPEFQHTQPFWFYVPVLLIAFLPWTAALVWSALRGGAHLWGTRHPNATASYFLSWALFCVAFFTTSRSKLPGYVLPVVPACALLLTNAIAIRVRQGSPGLRWLSVCVGLTLALLGSVATLLGNRIPFVTHLKPAPAVTLFTGIMVLGGLVVALLGFIRRGEGSLLAAVVTLLVFMILGLGDLWELDEGVSARPAVRMAHRVWPDTRLETAKTYKLGRGYQYGLNFYLGREVEEWTPSELLSNVIFTTHEQSEAIRRLGGSCRPYIVYPAVILCEGLNPKGVRVAQLKSLKARESP